MTDGWLESLKGAVGTSVGDLKPRFGPPSAKPQEAATQPQGVNPASSEASALIKEWIIVAEPPQNVIEGANVRYSPKGNVIGKAPTGTIRSTHDAGKQIDPVFLWENKRSLDSINHCTLEEYVIAKLNQKSIDHCAGRYGALKELKGERLDKAIPIVTAAGFKYSLASGSPAKTAEANGTIERQEPGPDQYLKKGQLVKLVVHTPYVAGKVTLPDFIGKPLGKARKWLQKNKLEMQRPKAGSRAPAKEKSGTIQAQEPVAGTVMKAGGKVTFTVHSDYIDVRTVPKVVKFSARKASELIENAGLKAAPKPGGKPPSRELAGTVKRQRPEPGVSVPAGSRVDIYIYGPYVDVTKVPDVRKLPYKEARRMLEEAGLSLDKRDAGRPGNRNLANTAKKQEPVPGTEISKGQTVSVWFYGQYVPTREEQVAATDCSGFPGSRAYWDDAAGKPLCGCPEGLDWSIADTKRCVPKAERSREACARDFPGSVFDGTYGANGGPNCACPEGYTWSADKTHCEKLIPPNELCAREYPGSVPTGRDANGKVICSCPQGYVWDSPQHRKCVPQLKPDEVCARDYPGSVSIGRAADGKINCGCPEGYTWSVDKTHCEKLISPNELCARDYPGSVPTGRDANGKVICSCPQGYVWDSPLQKRCVRQQQSSTGAWQLVKRSGPIMSGMYNGARYGLGQGVSINFRGGKIIYEGSTFLGGGVYHKAAVSMTMTNPPGLIRPGVTTDFVSVQVKLEHAQPAGVAGLRMGISPGNIARNSIKCYTDGQASNCDSFASAYLNSGQQNMRNGHTTITLSDNTPDEFKVNVWITDGSSTLVLVKEYTYRRIKKTSDHPGQNVTTGNTLRRRGKVKVHDLSGTYQKGKLKVTLENGRYVCRSYASYNAALRREGFYTGIAQFEVSTRPDIEASKDTSMPANYSSAYSGKCLNVIDGKTTYVNCHVLVGVAIPEYIVGRMQLIGWVKKRDRLKYRMGPWLHDSRMERDAVIGEIRY